MHAATATIEASPRAFVTALLPALSEASSGAIWPDEEPQRARAELGALFAPPGHWGPHDVIAVIEQVLPSDAVVTVDSGAHRILLSQQLRVRKRLGLLQSAGFCTMGAAIPLAGGAKAARPDTPVIAVLGDGGLEMGLGELATLRNEGLPVVIVVFQDESLALIEMKQAQAGLTRAGVRLGASRFEDIAEALGGKSWRVASRESFEAAFAAALQEQHFTLIICDIQVSDYAGKF
jgi:acetolactate synthase-1/2/3 large subunit